MALNTILQMTSAAGAGVLTPLSLRAEEAISMPFLFTVEMLASSPAIDPNSVLGLPACVTVLRQLSGTQRYFHGIMRSFTAVGPGQSGYWRYRCELVPQLWFTCQTVDCRIFQNMTGLAILQQLLQENNVTNTSIKAQANAQRDFTVQYNETDYDFLIRLMEEEGYFWFHTHTDSAHTLVVANDNTAFTNAALSAMTVTLGSDAPDVLTQFARSSVTAIGQVTLLDYDPLNPSTPVQGQNSTILTTPGASSRDFFRFPALTAVNATATSRALLRQKAAEATATLCDGIGTNVTLGPGAKFTISNDRLNGGADTIYVVRRIVHTVTDGSGGAGSAVDSYDNSFDAFPAATAWCDWPQDRRPKMAGLHSAVVLGNSGEEIHTDQYGRIKVKFFWDHRSDATADLSPFIRVMEPWSGNGWGWQHLPRVGSEVAVAFVDGDPDRPIVVGSLYNAEQMPPFTLPGSQTKTGLRTRSTTQGGTANYSEFSIDDNKGSELVFLHAEKDFTEEVENNHSTHVMQNQTLEVDGTRSHSVTKTESIKIGDAQTVTIGNGRNTTVNKADDVLTVDPGNVTITAKQGNISTTASVGNISTTASQGNISTEASAGNISTTADQGNISTTATMGNISVEASAGAVSVTAMQSISLKVGDNSVVIDTSGVTINGMMVSVKGTMQTQITGLMTTLKGDAMTTVKGAIVMIN